MRERREQGGSLHSREAEAKSRPVILARRFFALAIVAGALVCADLTEYVTTLAEGFLVIFAVLSVHFLATPSSREVVACDAPGVVRRRM